MQISDTDVKIAATEFLSHKGENPYRVTRRGAELWEDYAPAMRAALSALSLPVQPVAWRWPVEGGFIYCENKDEVLVEDGSEQPLYANPVPPTKGPEDDLIAAREAAASPCGIASPSYNDCPNMKEVGGGMEGERYWCALCSKGYFLDYEDMK